MIIYFSCEVHRVTINWFIDVFRYFHSKGNFFLTRRLLARPVPHLQIRARRQQPAPLVVPRERGHGALALEPASLDPPVVQALGRENGKIRTPSTLLNCSLNFLLLILPW